MYRIIITIFIVFQFFQVQPAVASGLCLFGLGNCLPKESKVSEIILDRLKQNWFALPNISFDSKYEIGYAIVKNNNVTRTNRMRVKAREFLDGRITELNNGVSCDSLGNKFVKFHNANVHNANVMSRASLISSQYDLIDFLKVCELFQDLNTHAISRGVEVVEVEKIRSDDKFYTFFLVVTVNNPSDVFIFADGDDYVVPTAIFGDLKVNKIYEQTVFGSRVATAEFEVSIIENRVGKNYPKRKINFCGRHGRGIGFFAESCQKPSIAKGTLKFEKRSDGWKPIGFEVQLEN